MGESHLNQSKPVEAYIMLLHVVSGKNARFIEIQTLFFWINGKRLTQYELQHTSTEDY